MKIVEDKNGERFLEFESKEDLEEFRKMLIEAYYELNPDRKRPCETWSPKWKLYNFLAQNYGVFSHN